VRLAALDLREISGVDLESPWLDPGILGILCFHLNSRGSHFLLNVTFLRKLRRLMSMPCNTSIT